MRLEGRIPPVALLVADEAHFVKNPAAARSQAVAAAIPRARRVCFMSGTPIENRVSEFRNLTDLLKPEVAREIPVDDLGRALILPGAFQHVAARVYLRRNQEDVLHELPEKIEVEEWAPSSWPTTASRERRSSSSPSFTRSSKGSRLSLIHI